MAIGRERAFPAGTVLMYQDEPADRIVILLEGRVKVTRLEGDGRESLLSIGTRATSWGSCRSWTGTPAWRRLDGGAGASACDHR